MSPNTGAFSCALSILLAVPALSQQHADLHPAGASVFVAVPTVEALPEAYEKTALWKILTDEDLAAAIESLSAGEINLAELRGQAMSTIHPDNFPPQLKELGLDTAVRNARAVSLSIELPHDMAGTFGPHVKQFAGVAAVGSTSSTIWSQTVGNGLELPADAAALASIETLGADDLTDAWGRAYSYVLDEESSYGFVLTSLGADGEPGGEGLDRDITSENHYEVMKLAQFDVLRSISEHAGLQVAFEFADGPSAERLFGTLTNLAADAGIQPSAIGANGAETSFLSLVDPGDEALTAMSPWVSQRGRFLFMGAMKNAPETFAARAATEFKDAGLNTDAAFNAAVSGLPKRSGTVVTEEYNSINLLAMAADVVTTIADEGGFAMDGGPVEIDDPNASALEFASVLRSWSKSSHPGAARTTLVDGDFHTDKYAPLDAAAAKAPRTLGIRPVSKEVFDFLNEENVLAYATTVDTTRLGESLRGMLSMLDSMEVDAESEQTVDPNAIIAALEERAGVSLEAGILAHLGEDMLFSSSPIKGVGIPATLLRMPAKDPAALEEGVAAWFGAIAEMFPEAVRYKDRPYKKTPLYVLSPNGGGLGALAVTVVDGWMVASLSATQAKKVIRAALEAAEGPDPEAEPVVPHPLASGDVAFDAGAQSVLYVDWGGYIGGAYSTAKAFGGMAAGMMGEELPFDLSALPEGEIVTRHIRPTVSTTTYSEDAVRKHSVGAFGPEIMAAGMFGSMAGLVWGQAQPVPFETTIEIEEAAAPPSPSTPPSSAEPRDAGQEVSELTPAEVGVEQTRASMRAVNMALEVFAQVNEGAYPASLDLLATPTESFPEGFIRGGAIPTDGWGRALVYRSTEGGGFVLYSLGPDGLDNAGAGDDLPLQ